MHHLVFSVRFDGSLREAIKGGKFLAGGHKIFLVNHIHIEAWVIIIHIFIYTISVLDMNFLRRVNKGMTVARM